MKLKTLAGALLMSPLLAVPALAHLDPGEHGSLMAGVSHPLLGLDHVLAMVAVGLWAALLGGRALWLVPSAFVGTMALGFAMALAGFKLPFVEPMVMASVVAIGLATASALRPSAPIAMALVAIFALFHGHAHGGELGGAGASSFAFGFLLATAALHGVGMGLGKLVGRAHGEMATRIAGGAAALGGVWLALGATL